MALAARAAMGKQKLQAFADRGYFSGTELKACEDAGNATYVPKPMTSVTKAEGCFDKSDFVYINKHDASVFRRASTPPRASTRWRKMA